MGYAPMQMQQQPIAYNQYGQPMYVQQAPQTIIIEEQQQQQRHGGGMMRGAFVWRYNLKDQ